MHIIYIIISRFIYLNMNHDNDMMKVFNSTDFLFFFLVVQFFFFPSSRVDGRMCFSFRRERNEQKYLINSICMWNSIISETEPEPLSRCQAEVVDAAVERQEVVEMLVQRLRRRRKRRREMSLLFTHITCVNIWPRTVKILTSSFSLSLLLVSTC